MTENRRSQTPLPSVAPVLPMREEATASAQKQSSSDAQTATIAPKPIQWTPTIRPYPPSPTDLLGPQPTIPAAQADSVSIVDRCADIHYHQQFWGTARRVAWWVVLLPIAAWCWASSFDPGVGRRATVLGATIAGAAVITISFALADPDQRIAAVDESAASEVLAPVADEREQEASTSTSSIQPEGSNSTNFLLQPIIDDDGASATVDQSTPTTSPPTSLTSTVKPRATTTGSTGPTTSTSSSIETSITATTTGESTSSSTLESSTTTTLTTTTEQTTTTQATSTTVGCHSAYNPCIPDYPGDALNCSDLSAGQKPVFLVNPGWDPYRLDPDGNGIGCEIP